MTLRELVSLVLSRSERSQMANVLLVGYVVVLKLGGPGGLVLSPVTRWRIETQLRELGVDIDALKL